MPIPTPKKNEEKNEFISRCMQFMDSDSEKFNLKNEKDRKQALAICYSSWERRNENRIIDKIETYLNESIVSGAATTTSDVDMTPTQKKKKKKKYLLRRNDDI